MSVSNISETKRVTISHTIHVVVIIKGVFDAQEHNFNQNMIDNSGNIIHSRALNLEKWFGIPIILHGLPNT